MENLNTVSTAEEFLNKEYYHIVLDSKDTWVNVGDIKQAMVEFAKLHVEAALKEASEKACGLHCTDYIDKDSILNSYSLDKIK